jgi:hypothetical protein
LPRRYSADDIAPSPLDAFLFPLRWFAAASQHFHLLMTPIFAWLPWEYDMSMRYYASSSFSDHW